MKQLITLNDALDYMDAQPDDWKRYQVHLPPKELNGWKLETYSIERDSIGRMLTLRDEGLDRDPGYGDGFTRLTKDGVLWMSDTRAEIMEHSPLINKLWWTENQPDITVLINGLGLGVAVEACLVHNVKHVDVIEIDQDVIAMCGTGRWPMDRVTVHHADAFAKIWPRRMTWTFAWHDIWPTIDPKNIKEMDQLQRKYRDKVSWQGSWQRKMCLRMRRLEKAMNEAQQAGNLPMMAKIAKEMGIL